MRDVVHYAHYRQVGVFGQTPSLDDLKQFSLDVEDFFDLRNCRPDDCDFRIRPSELEHVREIDWSRADARLRVNVIVRQMLIERVRTYLESGATEQFKSLFDAFPYLADEALEFRNYLDNYPRLALEGAEDVLFWSTEMFGGKPMIKLTHMSVFKLSNTFLIAFKDIYASRQFSAALRLTILFADPRAGRVDHTYLVLFDRSRVDKPEAGLGWFDKALLRGTLNQSTRENIKSNKRKIEAEYYGVPALRDIGRERP
jgi:hypothetical protein